MYAFIRGIVAEKGLDFCVIEAGGVGYLITATRGALARLGAVGSQATVYTVLSHREDDMQLLGFQSAEEKRMYQRLITVSGVGPKLAMAILSGLPTQELALALATGDEKRLSGVPGVGKKTAQRLILELNEQVARQMAAAPAGASGAVGDAPAGSAVQEAVATLIALGFTPSEAAQAAAKHASAGKSVEEIIKAVLSAMDAARR
nr:Holliday junction branch migration protein RuvA [bacterium]